MSEELKKAAEAALESLIWFTQSSVVDPRYSTKGQSALDAIDALRCALTHYEHDRTGFILVPEEPTEEMVDAACQEGIIVDGRPLWKHDNAFKARWRYKRMIEVARKDQAS